MIDREIAIIRIISLITLLIILFAWSYAYPHDREHPEQDQWYQTLTQPDAPMTLCCGEADAYWADEIHVRNGRTYAAITDDRPDEPLRRPHIDVGTEIEIPTNKLKWDRGNPTGHSVVFLSRQHYVYCFVQGSGI